MAFEESSMSKSIGQVFGFTFSYLIFTTILFFVLTLLEKIYGKDDPKLSQILRDSGELYKVQKKFKKAESFYERLKAMHERQGDNTSPSYAKTLNDLATVYFFENKYKRAEPLFQQALALLEEVLGKDNPQLAIVLENMGMLFYDYESSKYLNWIHEECPEDLVYEKKWNKWSYWEKYSDEQFNSLVGLCEYLCDEHTIEIDSIGHNVFYDKTDKFEGIVTRSNYSSDNTDLNPSFDFARFLNKLDIDYEY